MYRKLLIVMMCAVCAAAQAQIEVRTEIQATAADGDHNPLWLNANKYGLSSLDKTNGYVRAGAFRPLANDSAKEWGWGAGVDVAVATGFTSTLVVQQAYGELRWLKGLLTVGSKQQPMELRHQELSSGAQTLGINARPVPSIRLSLPEYWNIPYTNGWLALKGHIAYGMMTDDNWQKDFTQRQTRYTEHSMLHPKAGYLRIGKHRLTAELGLEMACQYGGTSYMVGAEQLTVENEGGLKGSIKALIPGGGEAIETIYRNTSGNHLGSWLARVNLDYDEWGVSVYGDHFFEDQSAMFQVDYDGYGTGSEWNVKKDIRLFLYDLRDMMLGAELRLKQTPWLNTVVAEYLYTKYQSGPVYHDHTQQIASDIGGRDEYYNHSIMTGWQHWGQVMGNPLYRSPLYNSSREIMIEDNRFWAWHLGVAGDPLPGLHYRALLTWQKGFGRYDMPFANPQKNVSMLAEACYTFSEKSRLAGWSVTGSFALDRGELLGDNVGAQVTVRKNVKM